MEAKRTLITLTLEQKCELISLAEKGEKQAVLASRFGGEHLNRQSNFERQGTVSQATLQRISI